jgi:hypothetical protein
VNGWCQRNGRETAVAFLVLAALIAAFLVTAKNI